MKGIETEKKFMFISSVLLFAIFLLTLVQNIIRYRHHASYSIWVSVIYLLVSVLFFIPFIFFFLRLQTKVLKRFLGWFWPVAIASVPIFLFAFYILSNVILHSFGYFDHFVDSEYARYYFGREALYHLLMLLGTTWYVFTKKKRNPTIDVFKGRKRIIIGLESIQWIEADGHYLNFHTETETYIKRERLSVLAKKLEPNFIRIHRKFIVNRNQIKSKEKEKRDEYILLQSGKRLKIGQSFKPISW